MIKNILIDCDGVLTDGKKYVNADGERDHIVFHSRDNTAIKLLIEEGYRVIIVTASRFPGIRRYWMKYGVEVFSLPDKKMTIRTEANIQFAETLGIGDDLIDNGFISLCEKSFVVADAHPQMKRRYPVLKTKGGAGVMAEVYDILVTQYQFDATNTVA